VQEVQGVSGHETIPVTFYFNHRFLANDLGIRFFYYLFPLDNFPIKFS